MKKDLNLPNIASENYQKELARILKAKRLEKGLSLNEVSKGICSVSYLSRLENNQIKFQDPYLKMLFEKLSINYDDLKKSRKQNLFLDLLKKNLLQQFVLYKDAINEMAKSNNYLDIEQELVLLYDNIIEQNYEEATIIMQKIDTTNYYYSNNEKVFYIYLVVLFYYKTNQINMAYRQLKVLQDLKIEDEILYWVIFELSMNINFMLGKKIIYLKDYMHFIKDAPTTYFSACFVIHKFRVIYLEALDDYEKALEKIKTYYSELNTSDEQIKYNYYYYLGLIYLSKNKYELILQTLSEVSLNSNIVKLLTIALINVENAKAYYHIIKLLNNYQFSKYEELIKNLYEYAMLKISNANVIRLQNYLKNQIYHKLPYYFDTIIYDTVIKELLVFNIKCSKYKEGCSLMINYLNDLKEEIIDR